MRKFIKSPPAESESVESHANYGIWKYLRLVMKFRHDGQIDSCINAYLNEVGFKCNVKDRYSRETAGELFIQTDFKRFSTFAKQYKKTLLKTSPPERQQQQG